MAQVKVFKARSAELPRDEPIKVLACLGRENNKMQRWLNRFYVIHKDRKHLQEKAQEQAIKPINEITLLDDDRYFRLLRFKQQWFPKISTYKY